MSVVSKKASSVRRRAGRALGKALSPVRAGAEKVASKVLTLDAPQTLRLTSRAFEAGKTIPKRYSAEGSNRSPPLAWKGVPKRAESIALIVEDPDAPQLKPFVHWMIWTIAADRNTLPAGLKRKRHPPRTGGAVQGRNDKGKRGYFGPLPPRGHGRHRYHFQLFALDRALTLKAGATRKQLLKSMRGHVLALAQLVGTYKR